MTETGGRPLAHRFGVAAVGLAATVAAATGGAILSTLLVWFCSGSDVGAASDDDVSQRLAREGACDRRRLRGGRRAVPRSAVVASGRTMETVLDRLCRRCLRAPRSAAAGGNGVLLGSRHACPADRGEISSPLGDGDRQRDARLVLGRRRQLPCGGRGRLGAADGRRGSSDRRRRRRVDAPGRRAACPPRRSLGRIEPVLEQLAGLPSRSTPRRPRWPRRALALGAEMVNDVTALRGDPGARRGRRRLRRLPLPDAHAGRAADDAGETAVRRRRVRGQALPGGASAASPSTPGSAEDADLHRPRDRLREDAWSTTSS